jgi:hypothetical protein
MVGAGNREWMLPFAIIEADEGELTGSMPGQCW